MVRQLLPVVGLVTAAAMALAACGTDPATLPFEGDVNNPSSQGGSGGTAPTAGSPASAAGRTSNGSTGGSSAGGGAPAGGTGGTPTSGGQGGISTSGRGSGGRGGSGPSSAGGSAGTAAGMGGALAMSGAPGKGGATGMGGAPGTAGRGQGNGGGAGNGAGGTSGSGGMPSGGVTFTDIGTFIQTTCGLTNCHGRREHPTLTNSDLSTLYTTLTTTTVKQCGSDPLVKPGDPANSALLELVQHQCGTFVMPDGCTNNPCITADDLAMITAWIQAGAPGP